MSEPSQTEKKIEVTRTKPGYGHVEYFGTYEGPVTTEDIEKRFESYFGGRSCWVKDGKWGYIVHTD
jgi:hypothetical protein